MSELIHIRKRARTLSAIDSGLEGGRPRPQSFVKATTSYARAYVLSGNRCSGSSHDIISCGRLAGKMNACSSRGFHTPDKLMSHSLFSVLPFDILVALVEYFSGKTINKF